ncbi:MAG: hypothetical protein ABIP39_14355 [Polyangiaceae bacterium]
MSEQDPPRLLDSSSPYVRSLLQAGESEVPDQAKLAALALKLGPILGGAGGAGGGGAITGKAAAAAKTASVGSALKIAGGTLLAATLAVSSAIYVPKMVGAPTRSTSTGITISDSTATPLATTSTLAPPVETIAPAAAVSASAVRKPAASVESPDAEVKLLERAQDALRTRPTEALALCTEHANRFPQGLLTQEREVIAIEALTQTGKMAEANARADRFAAAYPDSSHLRRVGALVGRKF